MLNKNAIWFHKLTKEELKEVIQEHDKRIRQYRKYTSHRVRSFFTIAGMIYVIATIVELILICINI